MNKLLLVEVYPLIGLFSAGYLVGSSFEPIWLSLVVGLPAGMVMWFLFRWLGLLLTKE